jgi:hypothetical protein
MFLLKLCGNFDEEFRYVKQDMSRLARSPVNEVAACNSAAIRKKFFS